MTELQYLEAEKLVMRGKERVRDERKRSINQGKKLEPGIMKGIESTSDIVVLKSKELKSDSGLVELVSPAIVVEENKYIKEKVKTRKANSYSEDKKSEEIQLNLNQRTKIEVPDYDNPVVPLSGDNIRNLWGVIADAPRDKFRIFQRSLETGQVGNKAAVKKISEAIYEIRPKYYDDRHLGELVRGEQEVYEVLKNIYGYEKAIEATNQMKAYPGEMAVVIFDRTVRHQELSRMAI